MKSVLNDEKKMKDRRKLTVKINKVIKLKMERIKRLYSLQNIVNNVSLKL